MTDHVSLVIASHTEKHVNATTVQSEMTAQSNSPYVKPAIVHELKLETRAGSPLGGGVLIDPLGLDPTQPH